MKNLILKIMAKENPKDSIEMTPNVQNLKNLISYQKGSVVSRSLIKKESGNITLFAFDKGENLSEHTSPYDAMVYLCDGEAEIKISGNIFNVKDGDMIILPANEPHALKAVSRFIMLLIMLKS
jgi:quercetin dioxygenase-like cupin family protein